MNKSLIGYPVKCLVTGFTGIVTARIEYLNGCLQYCVKPKSHKDNKDEEGLYIDASQLIIFSKKSKHIITGVPWEGPAITKSKKAPGGPQQDQPKSGTYSG